MQTSLPLYTPFTFDRKLHLDHYARMEQENEIKRIDYYKRRDAALRGVITKMKKQFKK